MQLYKWPHCTIRELLVYAFRQTAHGHILGIHSSRACTATLYLAAGFGVYTDFYVTCQYD